MAAPRSPAHPALMELLPFVGAALGSLAAIRDAGGRWKDHQARRLTRMLDHARDATELGRDRIPDQGEGYRRLEAIEPIRKPELMARFVAANVEAVPLSEVEAAVRGEASGLVRGRFVVAHTSGTTGRVGWFLFGRRSWARMNGALVARILRHRLVPHEVARFSFGRRYRMAMVAATGGPYISSLVAERRPGGAGLLADVRSFSVSAPPAELHAALERFAPHYLHGYPSSVAALAHARAQGELSLDPEFVSLGSEPLPEPTRARIQAAFPRAEIMETYGATEHLALANQCKAGALHLNTDLCVLEPMDAAGRPVPPGTPSEHVLLTNLVETAMPIIRYRLEDRVTFLPDEPPCPCGCCLPRIRVEGRSDDTLWLEDEDGRAHPFPPVPFEVLCLQTPGLAAYQIEHRAQNRLVLRFVPEPEAQAARVEAELRRRFDHHLSQSPVGSAVELEPIEVSEIPRGPGGKHRQIINAVPPLRRESQAGPIGSV